MTTALPTILVASLLLVAPLPAIADCNGARECEVPPTKLDLEKNPPLVPSNPTGAVSKGTYDTVYRLMWLGSQEALDDYWAGLRLEACDWDEGWGLYQIGNLDYPLTRLIDAAQVVWLVHQYARHPGFGLWRPVAPNVLFEPPPDILSGRWWSLVASWGEDEWIGGCKFKNGEHYQGVDEYNVLHLGGAYFSSTINRASTLVHETVHQAPGTGHVGASNCTPESESCEDVYSVFNSGTMQINFLHDAYVTYRTDVVDGETVRQVAAVGDVCSWIPRFAENERIQIADRVDGVMQRFEHDAWPGWQETLKQQVAAKEADGTWICEQCDPNDWTFDPNVCGATACNELLHPQNGGVNAANRAACLAYNEATTQSGSSAEIVAAAWQQFITDRLSCLPPDPAAARAYCDAQKASAALAGEVDQCGWLDEHYSDAVTKTGCLQEFCAERFEATGGWSVGEDPFDCATALCGDAGCGDVSDQGECAAQLVAFHADPELTIAGCEFNKCQRRFVDCLFDRHQAGTWQYGDAFPPQCASERLLCELASRLVLQILLDLPPFIDPGPLQEEIEGPYNRNPAKNLYRYAERFRELAASGADPEELGRLAVRLTSSPEMIAALYGVAPAEFAGTFGKQGFLEVLGPSIERVQERRIARSELSPAAQVAYDALGTLLAGQPGETFEGAIGMLRD